MQIAFLLYYLSYLDPNSTEHKSMHFLVTINRCGIRFMKLAIMLMWMQPTERSRKRCFCNFHPWHQISILQTNNIFFVMHWLNCGLSVVIIANMDATRLDFSKFLAFCSGTRSSVGTVQLYTGCWRRGIQNWTGNTVFLLIELSKRDCLI
jgi:hypothetical protein